MSPAQAPGRHDRKRAQLTRDTVADQALRLADTAGLDHLSIRRLATVLGVTPMALYWHFRSKEELLRGVAERVWAEIDTDVEVTAPWTAQLRGRLESLLRVLRAHRAAAPLLLQATEEGGSCLKATELTLEILREAGYSPGHASEIARSVLWTGIMLVMSEPGTGPLPAPERAAAQRRKQILLATLPAAQYPRLIECAIPLTACDDPDFHYELGVRIFIHGAQAVAAAGADDQRLLL